MAAVKVQRRQSPKKTGQSPDGVVPSPGKRLKQAREAMGMEVATVAEQLHLSRVMVHALEEENYEALPARVFVRGYYRNFARLVGAPVEVVLKEFGQLCPEGEDCSVPPAVAQGVREEIHSSHGLVRLVTWLIAIALITVFGLWWKSYLDKESALEERVAQTVPAAEIEEIAPVVAAPVQTAPQTPVVASPAAAMEKLPEVVAAPSPVAETENGASSAENEVPAPSAENEQQAAAVQPRVLLSFSGDCWVDVRDSSRSFKLVGRRQAGDKYELKGKPPYKMVLGSARNVSITIDGRPFDLAPYTKGNVAKLTFNPTNN